MLNRWISLVLSVSLGLLVVLVTLTLASRGISQAASLSPTSASCDLRAITVTAALDHTPGVSDTRPHSGISRTVFYVSPVAGTGKITLTVLVSVPASGCYFYGGRAFSDSIRGFKLTPSSPLAHIEYLVSHKHITPTVVQIDVAETPSGTLVFPHPQAILTFTPDIAPPGITIAISLEMTPTQNPETFDVRFDVHDDLSGVEMYTVTYQVGSDLPKIWFVTTTAPVTQSFTITAGNTITFTVNARDKVGNIGSKSSQVRVLPFEACIYLPVVVKNFPPTPVGQLRINRGDEHTYQLGVTLELSATIGGGDTVRWMQFSNDRAGWSSWMTFSQSTTWTLSPGNGLEMVYARFKGSLGGESPLVSDTILLFENGDFANGLSNWQARDGLGVSSPQDPEAPSNPVALLGDPKWPCSRGVPTDFSSLSQNLTIPHMGTEQVVKLKFRYRIFSNDRNKDLDNKYDSFDLLVDSRLAFRDANRTYFDYCNVDPYDLGWREGEYTFTSDQAGKLLTISFQVHNRGDHYYNTYVYLDDVHLVITQ